MRWRMDRDKEIRPEWKTAVCPHCGNRRPVEKFRMETVREHQRGGNRQDSIPVEVIRDCDRCR